MAERRLELARRHPTWVPQTLDAAFDAAAERWPDRPLVLTDERDFSYAEIVAWSRRIAAGLVEMGVEPGEHVALVMANYPEFVAVKLAIASAGAVAVPVNFLLRGEQHYVLNQSDARVLITMDRFRTIDYLKNLEELAPGWERDGGGETIPNLREVVVFSPDGSYSGPARTLDSLAAADPDSPELASRRRAADPHGLSDILYTSGTTGNAKGVQMTHDMVLRAAYGSAMGRAVPEGNRMGFALPMYHVFGYNECLLTTMFVGGAIAPRRVFGAADLLGAIERLAIDEIVCLPMMTMAMMDLVREDPAAYDLSSLRVVFSSGTLVDPGIWDEILEVLKPDEMTTGFGQTETTSAVASVPPDAPIDRLRDSNGRLRDAGVAGDPALGGRLALYKAVDPETGAELEHGQRGELIVRGPVITSGYYKNPEATADAFDEDGWFHTGDIGTVTTDGYVRMIGRLKEAYRCGGEMVNPREVELVLEQHPTVEQAHVVGIADPRRGEVGCAWIVPAADAIPDPTELIDHCKERLARFKVPRDVLLTSVEELPTTASTGRIQKFQLVELAEARLADGRGRGRDQSAVG
jgi:fatty-acyl-CoA synthase